MAGGGEGPLPIQSRSDAVAQLTAAGPHLTLTYAHRCSPSPAPQSPASPPPLNPDPHPLLQAFSVPAQCLTPGPKIRARSLYPDSMLTAAGFSPAIVSWAATNLRPISSRPGSSTSLTWTFDLEGIRDMYKYVYKRNS